MTKRFSRARHGHGCGWLRVAGAVGVAVAAVACGAVDDQRDPAATGGGVLAGASAAQPSLLAVAGHGASLPAARIALASDEPAALPQPETAPDDVLRGSAERRLIEAYRLVAAYRLDDALAAADALVRDYPLFKLAQLLQGDLMTLRAGGLAGFGTMVMNDSTAIRNDLSSLRDEARLRIQALQERPPQGAVPAEFVQLAPNLPYALVVDTTKSRLYVFHNNPIRPQLVGDYYVSIGKQGVDKKAEGDQRTPLGVYFITGRIDPRMLQDRFGSGALPLNYPNAYDKARGRTGSGILLHGVYSNTYSRPPLDSDGCVALANEDLSQLIRRLPARETPVVITRQIKWVDPAQAAAPGEQRTALMQAVQAWQQARRHAQQAKLASFYDTGDAAAAVALNAPVNVFGFSELSILTWGDDDKMVVSFKELTAGRKNGSRWVRQYWQPQGPGWRIVAQSTTPY